MLRALPLSDCCRFKEMAHFYEYADVLVHCGTFSAGPLERPINVEAAPVPPLLQKSHRSVCKDAAQFVSVTDANAQLDRRSAR